MRTTASLLVGVLVFEILAAPVSALAQGVAPGTRIRVTGDVFGIAGFVVGGVISLRRRTEKWEPVPVESLDHTAAAADSTG